MSVFLVFEFLCIVNGAIDTKTHDKQAWHDTSVQQWEYTNLSSDIISTLNWKQYLKYQWNVNILHDYIPSIQYIDDKCKQYLINRFPQKSPYYADLYSINDISNNYCSLGSYQNILQQQMNQYINNNMNNNDYTLFIMIIRKGQMIHFEYNKNIIPSIFSSGIIGIYNIYDSDNNYNESVFQIYDPRDGGKYGISNTFLQRRSIHLNFSINHMIIISNQLSYLVAPKPTDIRIYFISLTNQQPIDSMDCNENILSYFGTPIFISKIKNNIKLDYDKLTECSLDLKSRSNTYKYGRSNKGGWQSVTNVFTDLNNLNFSTQCIDQFINLYHSLYKYILIWFYSYKFGQLEYWNNIIENDESFIVINGFDKYLNKNLIKIDILHGWININYDLNWNGPHQHGIGDMSGVIYINNPSFNDNEGMLCYHDTRRFGNDHLRVLPEKSDIHIFPSWITHWTQPTYSNQPRISFAFNFNINIEKWDNGKNGNITGKYIFAKQLLATD